MEFLYANEWIRRKALYLSREVPLFNRVCCDFCLVENEGQWWSFFRFVQPYAKFTVHVRHVVSFFLKMGYLRIRVFD